jgi:hypothetical protein
VTASEEWPSWSRSNAIGRFSRTHSTDMVCRRPCGCTRRSSPAQSRRTSVAEILLAIRLRDQPPDLDSLPLTVLTRSSDLTVWSRLQDELAALSTRSQHIHARHAGHNIHTDEPEAVIEAIQDMVRRCRPAS